MRLLQCSNTGGYNLREPLSDNETTPPYAILSHTWGADGDEVTFDDLTNGTGTDKPGYDKIRFCAEQSRQDGLEYFWIDSCCINKEDKTEMSKAINSMFLWYRNADRCYVYLSDVSTAKRRVDGDACEWETAFRRSRWFTRGWTLQELLAPRVVEFFSRQRKRLGDLCSLKQQIHEITAIPEAALQGESLSQFSVNDRWSWIKHRETKLEEDKVYSLLGIFGVYMPTFYGEGIGRAFSRLQDEIQKLEECTRDLYVTDPERDKARIEETKGGLLAESYCWIFQNPDFLHWRNDLQSRLLWIKGDPGKGKTMLLCGIINELRNTAAKTSVLSYFFCQATDLRINSATAVLRGLLFMLIRQQPALISHLRKNHNQTGKALFEDTNAFVVLCEIFTDILQDSSLANAYFFIDALDECVKDLEKLLAFIVQKSSLSPRVKWILTSRNHTNIEQQLRLDDSGTRLSLELKENAAQVSCAVDTYINHRIMELEQIQHDQALKSSVREKMQQKANGTFLWVSLVMEELKGALDWEILDVLKEVPTELTGVYRQMMKHVKGLKRRNTELCYQILSTVVVTYRPLHLHELCALSNSSTQTHGRERITVDLVKMCGSFLTIKDSYVYLIHQSARDFLSEELHLYISPNWVQDIHKYIFSRSLQTMSSILQRDIFKIGALGCLIDEITQPDPDPLAMIRYSCIHWVDHLCALELSSMNISPEELQDAGVVHTFLRTKYIYWLEALSLCKSMSKGVISMKRLSALVQRFADASLLSELVHDGYRFITYHKVAIENAPLQAYASALLFSPERSIVRKLFAKETPNYITITTPGAVDWSACMQTLEEQSGFPRSVTFSPDSKYLASVSSGETIKIWDPISGECLQRLNLKCDQTIMMITSVVFSSTNAKRLASSTLSAYNTIKIWDIITGECLQTFGGVDGTRCLAFSPDAELLASGCECFIKIWSMSKCECLRTLGVHNSLVISVAFSPNGQRLVSVSRDGTMVIWNPDGGDCLQILESHIYKVTSVAFSPYNTEQLVLVSALGAGTFEIWDVDMGECLQTLKCDDGISSIAFLGSAQELALGLFNGNIEIWDLKSRKRVQTLQGHSASVESVACSPDMKYLATASFDETIKIWDLSSSKHLPTFDDHHGGPVSAMTFSADTKQPVLLSAFTNGIIKIWNFNRGECLQTLELDKKAVISAARSFYTNPRANQTVRLWDVTGGECSRLHSNTHYQFCLNGDGFRLDTVVGPIFIFVPGYSCSSSICEAGDIDIAEGMRPQGLSLRTSRKWITYNSRNIISIPPEYRPTTSVESGVGIAFGNRSGRVWICRARCETFEED